MIKNIIIPTRVFIFILLSFVFLFPLILQLSNIFRGLSTFYLLFPISIPYFLLNWLFVSISPSFYYETESITTSNHFIGWVGFLCFSVVWLILFSLLFYFKKSTREMLKISLLIALPLYILGFLYLGYITTNIPLFSPGFNSEKRVIISNPNFDSLNLKMGLAVIPEDGQASERARINGELPYFSYPCSQNGKNYTCSDKIFYFSPYIFRPDPNTNSYIVYLNGEPLFSFPLSETNSNYLSLSKIDDNLLVHYGNQSSDKGYEKYVLYDTVSKQTKFIKFNVPGYSSGIAYANKKIYVLVNGLNMPLGEESKVMTYDIDTGSTDLFTKVINNKCKISFIGIKDESLFWSEGFENKRWASKSFTWNPSCFVYKKQLFQ